MPTVGESIGPLHRIGDIRSYVCPTSQGRTFLFIVVETEDGLVGFGEASQNDQDQAVVANIATLRSELVGKDIFELVERIGGRLSSGRAGRAWSVAISAVEMALWDLMGKATRRPVYQLLGGAVREKVICYATVAAGIALEDPGRVLDECRRVINEGFANVKVVPFPGIARATVLDRELRCQLDAGLELLNELHRQHPSVGVAVECNFSFSESVARFLAARLGTLGVLWMEAPLWWDDAAGLRRLREFAAVAVASGELLHGKASYRELIESEALDIVQPDVKWCGGCLEARKIAAWAEVHQIAVAPHNNSGPIATAASAHLAICLPNLAMLEVSSVLDQWESGIASGVVETGAVSRARLAAHGGLGVELDEGDLRQLTRDGV